MATWGAVPLAGRAALLAGPATALGVNAALLGGGAYRLLRSRRESGRNSMPEVGRYKRFRGPSNRGRRGGPKRLRTASRRTFGRRFPWKPRFLPRLRRRGYRRRVIRSRRKKRTEVKKVLLEPQHAMKVQETRIPGVAAVSTALGTSAPVAWPVLPTPGPVPGTTIVQVPTVSFLGGVSIPRGTGRSERIGNKVFLMHTSLKLNVAATFPTNLSSPPPLPIDFRLVVLKVRRTGAPQPTATTTEDAINQWDQMFLRTEGSDYFGPGSSDQSMWPSAALPSGSSGDYMTPAIFQRALTNKNRFRIYKDYRFTLGPPTVRVPTANSDYPNIPVRMCHKNLFIKLKHNRSVSYYDFGHGPVNEIRNYDYRYQVFLFASYNNHENMQTPSAPLNWTASFSGLTTYTDA